MGPEQEKKMSHTLPEVDLMKAVDDVVRES